MNKRNNKKVIEKKKSVLKNKERIKKVNVIQVSNPITSCSMLSVKTPKFDEFNIKESDLFRNSEALKDTKVFWRLRYNYEKRKEEAAKRVCLHYK